MAGHQGHAPLPPGVPAQEPEPHPGQSEMADVAGHAGTERGPRGTRTEKPARCGEQRPAGRTVLMRALLQRVSSAAVTSGGRQLGRIGPGLVVLLAIPHPDTAEDAERLRSEETPSELQTRGHP